MPEIIIPLEHPSSSDRVGSFLNWTVVKCMSECTFVYSRLQRPESTFHAILKCLFIQYLSMVWTFVYNDWPESHKSLTLLSSPSQCWDHKHVLPCLTRVLGIKLRLAQQALNLLKQLSNLFIQLSSSLGLHIPLFTQATCTNIFGSGSSAELGVVTKHEVYTHSAANVLL